MNQVKNRFRGRLDRRTALRCRARPQVERLEDRVVPDVGSSLATALATGIGPGEGVFSQPREAIGGDSTLGSQDVDLYAIVVPAGDIRVVAITTRPPGAARLNTALALFTDTGVQLAANDDRPALTPALAGATMETGYSTIDIALNSLLEQTLYIGVSASPNVFYDPTEEGTVNPGPTGEYSLTIMLIPAGTTPTADQGATLGTAFDTGLGGGGGTFLSRGSLGDSTPASTQDVDLYSFTATAGSALTALTAFPAGLPAAAAGVGSILRLFDANGVELALNDNRGPIPAPPAAPPITSVYSLLDFTFPATGTYYLGVSSNPNGAYSPTTGAGAVDGVNAEYSLVVSLTPPPAGSISGQVFNDLNGDGVKDGDEPGLAGFFVYLDQNRNGQFDDGETLTATDDFGNYTFFGLPPGTYTVAQLPTDGWVLTSPSAATNLIEGFNRLLLPEYTVFDPANLLNQVASAHTSAGAALEDTRGLLDQSGNDWIIRNDQGVQVGQGDSIVAWVRLFGATTGPGSGRAYFGFGATALGALSVQLATNTGQFLLQQHTGYGFVTLAAAAQEGGFVTNQWYRILVTWGADGTITAQLFAEDGVTQLNQITGSSSAITSGGIAFRTFGNVANWDAIRVFYGLPSAYTVTLGAGQDVFGRDFGNFNVGAVASAGNADGNNAEYAQALPDSADPLVLNPDVSAPEAGAAALEPAGVDQFFAAIVDEDPDIPEAGLPDDTPDNGLEEVFPPDGLPDDGTF